MLQLDVYFKNEILLEGRKLYTSKKELHNQSGGSLWIPLAKNTSPTPLIKLEKWVSVTV